MFHGAYQGYTTIVPDGWSQGSWDVVNVPVREDNLISLEDSVQVSFCTSPSSHAKSAKEASRKVFSCGVGLSTLHAWRSGSAKESATKTLTALQPSILSVCHFPAQLQKVLNSTVYDRGFFVVRTFVFVVSASPC